MSKVPIGKQIQRERKRARMTQSKLADLLDMSQIAVSYIESGRRMPSLVTLEKIAAILKCTLTVDLKPQWVDGAIQYEVYDR